MHATHSCEADRLGRNHEFRPIRVRNSLSIFNSIDVYFRHTPIARLSCRYDTRFSRPPLTDPILIVSLINAVAGLESSIQCTTIKKLILVSKVRFCALHWPFQAASWVSVMRSSDCVTRPSGVSPKKRANRAPRTLYPSRR